MKLEVVMPTKGGYCRELSLNYVLQSCVNQYKHHFVLEILIAIDGRNCKDIKRIEHIADKFNVQSSLEVNTITYCGYNPTWGGIFHLKKEMLITY
ncbi:MAG: hypothetical protein NDF55_08620 [archaeon GB-1867-005]|nr:hypothetical protein [Candidatus Culexmicrobium cathedralense]